MENANSPEETIPVHDHEGAAPCPLCGNLACPVCLCCAYHFEPEDSCCGLGMPCCQPETAQTTET